MKTIQITDEMYNSLMELSKEINNQDHRHTQMPYMLQIQTKESYACSEGQGEEIWFYDGSVISTDEEIKEVIIEYREWEGEDKKQVDDWTDPEIEATLGLAGWQKAHRDFRKNYQNAFLTAKACKEHIEANGHHYTKPNDYLVPLFRNPEMELVFKFLCGLTGGKPHK